MEHKLETFAECKDHAFYAGTAYAYYCSCGAQGVYKGTKQAATADFEAHVKEHLQFEARRKVEQAAPALFDACEVALDALDGFKADAETIKLVQDAIKKAKGE